MTLTAEVTEQGVLRVKSPALKPGDEVILETNETEIRNTGKGKWSEIKKALAKANTLDFLRRTHEEILRDLHELRG
ncbi:MAG: hypothetical protein C4527_28050 [Candidatus Omnitrophota bacterium]|jgi:hypothetical protein|nr:MAG: hypothetical protein C4527_28050 [Candidatus Omnitrophota bacterium]